MNGSIICREASKTELPQVLQLYAQPGIDDGKVLPLSQAERIFDRIERYPDYKIYVAIIGTTIVGTFTLLIMENLGHLGASSGVIEDVAVDPEWQGRGVGKIMMQHALQLCSKKGCYKAVLSSNLKRNLAHTFYESLNFERHGYSFCTYVKSKDPEKI
ncbi:MAG: GNAT family N-acetyltransferase [Proteobacteria bacterium]|nr:GNAT family N-acetyltransferase [Pseudomonadota bacterium]